MEKQENVTKPGGFCMNRAQEKGGAEMVDWSRCGDVERVYGKGSGAWLIKGTRISADAVVANADDGYGPEEIAAMFEGLPIDVARRVIDFAQHANARTA
jgi:uncharacterized protein (DUF433 family)